MSTTDTGFLCRLLCAADAAYGISPTGPFVQDQPYYDQAGFIGQPTAISAGLHNIDAALVGLTGDGIVVAYRGTLPPIPPITPQIVLDWLQDFIAIPDDCPGFPGKIHKGFGLAIARLWPGVLHAVQTLHSAYPDAAIQVTGHSKGGALATLGAWLLHSNGLAPTNVVTFASPHVGNAELVAAYNAVLSQVRYENYLDLVPFVPPTLEHLALIERIPHLDKLFARGEDWSFEPVGELRYIAKNGRVVGDHAGLAAMRIAGIAVEIARGDVAAVAHAHSLVRYPLGYCRAVGTDRLCAG